MQQQPSCAQHCRGQIRDYVQRFTTAIRRASPSKDETGADILQTDRSAEMRHGTAHSYHDTPFNFSGIIVAEEPPTATNGSPKQLAPGPSSSSPVTPLDTFCLDRTSLYQDRIQKLHDRYGIQGTAIDRCNFPSTVRRVQKNPRMRVHRSCHLCGVDYGHGVHCRACHHRICSSCPRVPGRRIQDVMAQVRQDSSMASEGPMEDLSSGELHTGSSSPAPGPSLPSTVQEKALHRFKPQQSEPTRPLKAETTWPPSLQPDDDAFDIRPALLTRAPRSGTGVHLLPMHPRSSRHAPHSATSIHDSSPTTGPGVRRVFRKPRQRVRFACHECHLPFQSHAKTCAKCGHDRCLECRTRRPGGARAEPDPALVEAVNLRLARVG